MVAASRWTSKVVFWAVFTVFPRASAQEAPSPFVRSYQVEDGKIEPYTTSLAAGAGHRLVLFGTGFGTKEGRVLIGSTASRILKWKDTSIALTVPKQQGSPRVNLTVENAAGKSCQVVFHFTPQGQSKAEKKK